MTVKSASVKAIRLPSLFSRSPWISRSEGGSVTFRPARVEHIPELVDNIRRADFDELTASYPADVTTQMIASLSVSVNASAAFGAQGELLCLFGVSPYAMMGETAAPWLIGTNALPRYPQALVKGAYRYLGWIEQFYPALLNFVDARNTLSIKWLQRMGFTIDEPQPFGHKRLPFHRFHRGFDDV